MYFFNIFNWVGQPFSVSTENAYSAQVNVAICTICTIYIGAAE